MVLLTPRRGRDGELLIRQPAGRAGKQLRAAQGYAASRPEWPRFARGIARLPCFELRRGAHPSAGVAALKQLLRQLMVCRRSAEIASTAFPAR